MSTSPQVHIASPHNPSCSLDDAADVLADALLLSCCGHVVHMDSNVTSAVALMSPDARMEHVIDVLDDLELTSAGDTDRGA